MDAGPAFWDTSGLAITCEWWLEVSKGNAMVEKESAGGMSKAKMTAT